jgi:hypothetical protein
MDRLLGALVALGQIGLAAATRISIMVLCSAFAAVAATGAVGCLVAALWVAALPHLGPAGAALAAAGALGLISLIPIALVFTIGHRGRRQARVSPDTQTALIEVSRLLKESKGAMLLGALIAGLAAGSAHRGSRSTS